MKLPNVDMGSWFLSLLTRRSRAKREVNQWRRHCEKAVAALGCSAKDGYVPHFALAFANDLGPNARQYVLMCSRSAATAVRTACEALESCNGLDEYHDGSWQSTGRHEHMLAMYLNCSQLLAYADSKVSSLRTELALLHLTVNGLPARLEAYDTEISQLKRVLTALYWNGGDAECLLSAHETVATYYKAAQLAWEENEVVLVHQLLAMVGSSLAALRQKTATIR